MTNSGQFKKKQVNNSQLNMVIDLVLFILLLAITGLGLLIKFCLLPGYERNVSYGSAIDLEFLGLNRHQWGTVHLYVSLVFIALLIVHIVLHWKTINTIISRLIPKYMLRKALYLSLLILSIMTCVGPFLLNPTIVPATTLHRQRGGTDLRKKNIAPGNRTAPYQELTAPLGYKETASYNNSRLNKVKGSGKGQHRQQNREIRGSLTLEEVASRYNLDSKKLAHALNVPVQRKNEHLGHLCREFNFSLNQVREYIEENTAAEDK
ncbi:MAG: DUF4405 domain-containing protein [Bacteroidota bacterium]